MGKIIFNVLLFIYKELNKIFPVDKILRFRLFTLIIKLLIFPFKKTFIEVEGHKMYLDSNDSLLLSIYGTYEPFTTEIIKKEVKKNYIVIDIGANIGWYTLTFAKIVGNDGKIFSFEPEPTNFALLKKNIEINGYKNVILEQKAISDKTGEIKLYLSGYNNGDHRIYDSRDGRQFIKIESIQLDEYFKDYKGNIDFIKIDIQGAEGRALKGGLNLLKKTKKIITEFWPFGLYNSGMEPKEYLVFLLSLGFKLYEINEQEKKINLFDIDKILKKYTIRKRNYLNILCEKN
jgi:FkbM family methyltransferase